MRTVQKWLDSKRNYYAGVALLAPYCTDKKLWAWITEANTPERHKRLVELAQSIIAQPEEVKAVAKPIKDRAIIQRVAEMPLSDDPILKALHLEWKAPYSRMKYLQQKLDEYGESNRKEDVAACYDICKEIVELDAQVNQIWAKRDHYLEKGSLPDQDADEFTIPTDPMKLAKLIDSIKKNIRRNRAKMTDEPDNPAHVQRYLLYKDRFKKVTGNDYNEKN